MTTFEAFTVRRLTVADRADARELAEQAGVMGVYVVNSLASPHIDDRALGIHGPDDVLIGLAWLGFRGNLIVLTRRPFDPTSLVATLSSPAYHGWRVALGPDDFVRALVLRERQLPLVDRTQVFYAATSPPPPGTSPFVVRPAVRADVPVLVEAALDLSESDLNVPAWRVHRAWLRDSVRRRIREKRTFVIGDVGDPICKLDIGSRGPAGVVLEGVHTRRGQRGRGLAAALVADVLRRELEEHRGLVCLHVGAENGSARAAYERAGMEQVGSCRLMLRA
jgi:GNAT superfamily N-acetyltransferase